MTAKPLCVSSHMYRAKGQAVSLIECDRIEKKIPFIGLESYIFCYPDRCSSQLDYKGHLIFVERQSVSSLTLTLYARTLLLSYSMSQEYWEEPRL